MYVNFSRKGSGAYSLGFHTHSVPMALHDLNRKRLLQRLKDKKVSEKSVVLLEGGKSSDFQRYSSDVCHAPFRQVSEVWRHISETYICQCIRMLCGLRY